VRPVEADPVPHGAAQELVDRDAERARLHVHERVLDGADGLLDDAARRGAAERLHQRHLRLEGARVLADEDGDQAADQLGQPWPAERLVVLAPADEPLVGRDLDEIEASPAGVGMEGLRRGDPHRASQYTAG
jgi:hypothetical protein